jgi:hypothetical protein
MRYSTPQVTRFGLAVLAGLLIGVVVHAAVKGPDAGGYVATDATVYSFIDVSGASGGASVLSGTDDGLVALTLPFAFTFYGQAYTTVCASTNGALYFVTAASACADVLDFAHTDLTNTTTANDWPAVLPFWSDLTFDQSGAGAVFYQALGAAGARKFVVQWQNGIPQGSQNAVTFQVVLAEGANTILYQYKTVGLGAGNPASNGAQATIGIRNAGAPGNNQQLQWSVDAPVLGDGTALLFKVAGDITPPVLTARAAGKQVQLNWTNVNVAGYAVYRGTTTGGPYVKLAQVPGTQLLYLDRNLTVGATYYWVVRPLAANMEEGGKSNQVTAKIAGR